MTLRSFWRTEAPSHPKISFPFFFPPCGGGSGGSRTKWQGNFGCACRSEAEAGPRRQTPMRTQKYRITTRAARGRCSVQNEFELGTIETPEFDSLAFDRRTHGRHEVPPMLFALIFQHRFGRRLRRRQRLFRRGGGSTSESDCVHSICFGYKKNFLLQ